MKPAGVDYTETSPSAGTVTFVTAPVAGSTILISYSKTIGQDVPKLLKQSYVTGTVSAPYTGSTTVFDLPFTYTPGSGSVLVFSGGVLMIVTSDYTETDTDTITFVSARTTGEIITFIKLGIAGGESGQTGGWNDQGTYVTLDTSTDQVRIGDGAVGTPGLAFASDTNTGLYRVGTDNMALVANGTQMIEFDSARVNITGSNTNDSAAAGKVGQYVESVVSAVNSPSTGQYGDMTSVSLTAGDWDVTLISHVSRNGATINANSAYQCGISVTSGNSSTGLVAGSNLLYLVMPTTADNESSATVAVYRMSLSTTTTVYAKMRAEYASGGPPLWDGRLSARRVR